MSDLRKDLGKRLKDYRMANHMTQEQISEKLEISIKHYSEIERGMTGMSMENLVNLHDRLGLSLDYLLCGDADAGTISPDIIAEISIMSKPKRTYLVEFLKIVNKM